MKKIAILGSTGSIGTQTLQVVQNNLDKLQVCSLVAYSNKTKLNDQARQFNAQYSALICEKGEQCLIDAVQNCDVAVVATRGIVALDCILYCLQNGIDVALANKEALVCGGQLIKDCVKKGKIYPVDSEHCAISQCLLGRNAQKVNKLLLTASGGPFYNLSSEELKNVTAVDALKHPNWNMGEKITIDSATMMNKALEVLEASWLFDVDTDKIDIVVHRQSLVHSMVQFDDGSVVSQMATPDMKLPISVALLQDEGKRSVDFVDFSTQLNLTFESCNFDKFPCAQLGHIVSKMHPLCATIMNATNDVCVESFLQGKLSFTSFYNIITDVINHFAGQFVGCSLSLDNVKLFDNLARIYAKKVVG